MDSHTPSLCVDTCTQHGGGTEQHPHRAFVHGSYHRLSCPLVLTFLNEADFRGRYAVVFYQLALDFGIHVPFARSVCSQVGEHELRTLVAVVALVVVGYHLGAMARLVVGMVVTGRVYHAHVECHLSGIVRGNEHLRLFLRFRQGRSAENGGIARLGKLHQLLDEVLLFGCRRYVVKNLVLLRSVHTDRLCRSVVGYLVVEGCKLRHLDEISETLLLHDVVGDVELKVGGLLGEDCRPRIETADVLTLQFLGTEVFEKEVKLGKRVADGCSRKERRPQVPACPLLYGSDGKEHVERFLASLAVAESRHTVVPGVEHEVLELVALVHKQVVDAHHAEVHHIIGSLLDAVGYLLQLHLQVELSLFQAFEHSS